MIDGIRNGSISPFVSRNAPARETAAADPSQPVRRVAETGAAKPGFGALVAELAKAPPVDSVRIASLKAAIADGSYRIDPDAIAGAMLRLDRGRP
jgi:negative regulator of flagellin synthesis FlgM